MGRTNPTYRRWLDRQEATWQPFRRSLRVEHQADFDRLFDRAAEHASAAGFQNDIDPRMGMLLSILLSQERTLRQIEAQLDAQYGIQD